MGIGCVCNATKQHLMFGCMVMLYSAHVCDKQNIDSIIGKHSTHTIKEIKHML